MLSIDCPVLVVVNPFGPVHTVFTVTGVSTTRLSSTMQVKVTLAVPIGRMGLAGMLIMLADTGTGTFEGAYVYV